MSLYADLQKVRSEEDVKDAYIKALGLKKYTKGLIDIQTKEVWFEAKDTGKTSVFKMFTQLLHYVQDALNKGEQVPPFLCVIDTQKAAIMKSSVVIPFLQEKTIKWGKSASDITKDALDRVSSFIGTHFVSFKIETQEEEFIETVKAAIKAGDIIRIQITPDNLRQVFDKWVDMIGREIEGVSETDYALLFYADIMHDGKKATHENLPVRLLHEGDNPVFLMQGKAYNLSSSNGYHKFWAIYHKPPKEEHRNYLLERRDSLIPIDERSFKGAYYTPLKVVDKAYDKLTEVLGKNWQQNYIVWDMCCGVGNLEVKHSNHRNVFMSTLDQADIDVMKASKTCVAAHRFQYDYLNDDIAEDGSIDYSITDKMPKELREAIADFNAKKKGAKKILILINPPYAEAGSSLGKEGKGSVSRTKIAPHMQEYGKASNELFTQFLFRCSIEIPESVVAIFSKLKYITAPNFEKFRQNWNGDFQDGFIVHSKVFEGLKGNFPIGFLVWKTKNHQGASKVDMAEIVLKVIDRNISEIGEKTLYNLPNNTFLNVWFERPRPNRTDVVPLKNAFSPYVSMRYFNKWSDNAIGYMWCQNNDLQHASQQTVLFSSVWGDTHGFYVTEDNLWQAAIVFSVRRLIKPTWINDRDQFLQPTEELSDEFKNDCLIWMLFNGSNLTAGANDLEWNDKKWSLVNHFIPFTETDVGAKDRFESHFMVDYLKGKKLSKEAKDVMTEGKKLWKQFYAITDERSVRDELKLNRPDVGWYQIRKALEKRFENGTEEVSFTDFKLAYDALSDKLRPLVYEFGFLKE